MATEKDEVLLKIEEVRFKKREGSLSLMDEIIVWAEENGDNVMETHKYADIKFIKISPEGKPKVQLQLVLADDSSLTFHFVNHESHEAILSDREKVKEFLEAKMMTEAKVDVDLINKNNILSENPKLFQAYKNLVISQVIPSEEFWKLYYGNELEGNSHNLRHKFTLTYFRDIRQPKRCEGVHKHITPRIIEKVFNTNPAIREHFEQMVPDKMTCKEFWDQFMESKFVNRQPVPKPNNEELPHEGHETQEADGAHGSVKSDNIEPKTDYGLLDEEQAELKLIELAANWSLRTPIEKILHPIAALNATVDLSPGGFCTLGPPRQEYPPIPPEVDEEYDHLYDSLQVLIKQFWSSVAKNSPDLEEKIWLYHDAVMLFKEKLIQPFTRRVTNAHPSLASLTQPMILIAECVHAKHVVEINFKIDERQKEKKEKKEKLELLEREKKLVREHAKIHHYKF